MVCMGETPMPLCCFPSEDPLDCKSIRLCLLALAITAAPALCADFTRDAVPGKWIAPLVPEQLPPLKYPAYFNNFEKAKQQVWTGRYKLALQSFVFDQTDRQGVRPASYADLKAQALAALGRVMMRRWRCCPIRR
jgi:hypothetical protein